MCGHRPYTARELSGGNEIRRGDRMGQRPEVDRVNVRGCDGTLTADSVLFGPTLLDQSRKFWSDIDSTLDELDARLEAVRVCS